MKLKWNKLQFQDNHEYYETLGLLSRDDSPFDLKEERNNRAGAWGGQIRFYWRQRIDFDSLPRALKEAFVQTSNDSQHRLSATSYVKYLSQHHSYVNDNDTSYTAHWAKSSLDDVLLTIPDEFKDDFWRGYYWNYELQKKIRSGADIQWDQESHQVNGVEGAPKGYYVTKYERKKVNRDAAIAIHGTQCCICGFDFEHTYGEIGKNFIEVHHIKPLATLDEEVVIDPATDLICVCSNCHRMLHRFTDYMIAVDELKHRLRTSD